MTWHIFGFMISSVAHILMSWPTLDARQGKTHAHRDVCVCMCILYYIILYCIILYYIILYYIILYIYMYVYYIYMYVYYIYMHIIYMYILLHIYIYISYYIYTYVYIYIYHVCMYVCIIYIHTRVYLNASPPRFSQYLREISKFFPVMFVAWWFVDSFTCTPQCLPTAWKPPLPAANGQPKTLPVEVAHDTGMGR